MADNNQVEKTVNDCYEKYYQSIYKFCFVRLGELNEHAADCIQDTFLVLHNKLLSGEIIEQPRAFLYKTADNFVKNTIKQNAKQRHRTVPLEEAETKASPPVIADNFDYDKCVVMLVALLSPDEQELYKMKYIERKSLNEISEILNISPAAAAKRTSRLRQRIKELIKEQNLFGNEVTL